MYAYMCVSAREGEEEVIQQENKHRGWFSLLSWKTGQRRRFESLGMNLFRRHETRHWSLRRLGHWEDSGNLRLGKSLFIFVYHQNNFPLGQCLLMKPAMTAHKNLRFAVYQQLVIN